MEQSQKKKKKKVYTKQITALVFLGLLVFLCFCNLIFGDRKAQKPKLTAESVMDGSYMEEYGSYFNNRFFGKGVLKGLDFSVRTAFGNRKSEGIYRGKGEALLEEIAKPDDKAVKESIQKIQQLSGTYYNIPVYFMLVPNAAGIQPEKLPSYAAGRNQKKQFEEIKERLGAGINWVDVTKVLEKHGDEDIYYRTDEHWTSLGAFYGYEALAASMGIDTSKAPELKPYVVNNDFNGSLSWRSGYGNGYKDSITIYAPGKTKDSVRMVMTNMDTKKKSATFYDSAKLEGKDKYSLFLGGDAGMTDIKTTADTTERLLIFKDSYANCLIPFLAPYYREIIAIDPALYKGNVQEIMQKARFTSILFLYNGNSFVTDTYLSRVLRMSDELGAPGQSIKDVSGAQDEGLQDEGTQDTADAQDEDVRDASDAQDEDVRDASDAQDEDVRGASDAQDEDVQGEEPDSTSDLNDGETDNETE